MRAIASLLLFLAVSEGAEGEERSKVIRISVKASKSEVNNASFKLDRFIRLKEGSKVLIKTKDNKTVGYLGVISSGGEWYGEWIKRGKSKFELGNTYWALLKMEDIESRPEVTETSSKPVRRSIREFKKIGVDGTFGPAEPLTSQFGIRGFWNATQLIQISWGFGIRPSSLKGSFLAWSLSPRLLIPGINPSPFIGVAATYAKFILGGLSNDGQAASLFDTTGNPDSISKLFIYPVAGLDWIVPPRLHIFATLSHTRFVSSNAQQGLLFTLGLGGAFGGEEKMKRLGFQ